MDNKNTHCHFGYSYIKIFARDINSSASWYKPDPKWMALRKNCTNICLLIIALSLHINVTCLVLEKRGYWTKRNNCVVFCCSPQHIAIEDQSVEIMYVDTWVISSSTHEVKPKHFCTDQCNNYYSNLARTMNLYILNTNFQKQCISVLHNTVLQIRFNYQNDPFQAVISCSFKWNCKKSIYLTFTIASEYKYDILSQWYLREMKQNN